MIQPKTCGYYLAKWRFGKASFRVSELWYDGSNWWSRRDYVDGDHYSSSFGRYMTNIVVAWINKPSVKDLVMK